MVPKATIIALVPRDEAGLRSAELNLPGASKRAIYHTGVFVIQAAARLISENAFAKLFSSSGGNLFTVTDATIRCMWPGPKFQEMKSRAIILNRSLVQFYHAAQ
jgi:hypothetical protein